LRVSIIAVGRARDGPERALYDTYVGRLPWPVRLVEVEAKGRRPAAELKRREAELLLKAAPALAVVVALDERGRAMDSAGFAGELARWRDSATELAFIIGGADGLHDSVRNRARLTLSLGPMTWPHMLVRVLLAEQLWRAHSILAGHPYHRA
jgi:23S rRNA (pseudouridine1915-N3)-methyltransferase